jgi:Leu/Phe-tRNA-protein transferase
MADLNSGMISKQLHLNSKHLWLNLWPNHSRSLRLLNSLKITLSVLLISLITIGSSRAALAETTLKSCLQVFESVAAVESVAVNDQIQISSDVLTRQVMDLVEESRRGRGISPRGFLGNNLPMTAEANAQARKFGLMRWGLRIYVQPTIEAARKHAAEAPNLLMQGVYLIGDVNEIAPNGIPFQSAKLTDMRATEYFNQWVANGLYYFNGAQVLKIRPDLIAQWFQPGQLNWIESEPARGPYIYQNGWFNPKRRGVILYADTQKSTSYKNVNARARHLSKTGFKVTFNNDFIQSLNMVRDQDRKGQNQGSSRFTDPEVYQAMVDEYKNGQAFSVEVWDDKGRLIAGLIGSNMGNLYSPDSVFYDNKTYKQAIDYAKIAFVALGQRLIQVGIPFMDVGMVTPFTATLKAKLVPVKDFASMLQALPAEKLPVDFSDWVPESQKL